MTDHAIVLSVAASVIGFFGYVPYIRDTLKGTTKPHVLSWLGWGALEVIAFFAQLTKGAGPGAWVTGASALIVIAIAVLAVRNHDTQIHPFDSVAFIGAIIGAVLWAITSNPLLAVISVSVADALAFLPTFRKAYAKPHEETLSEFGLSAIKWAITIPALQSFNLTTALYPASLVCTNSLFVVMVLVRRYDRSHPIAKRNLRQ